MPDDDALNTILLPVNDTTAGQKKLPDSTTPKHTRAGKPKSKSGCRTCKVRRVKCDETRPSCLRCMKIGQECPGYPAGGKPLPSWTVPIIVPKITTESRTVTAHLASLPPTSVTSNHNHSIPRAPRPQMFTNDSEYRYFQLFCRNTASRLGGYFNSSLFDRFVLQSCENQPAIRFVVIAIGALDATLGAGLAHTSHSAQGRGEMHHRSALQYYAKAINHMRHSISGAHQDLRSTLLSCLLFVCFECFNGNNSMAITQARSGIKLFNLWRSETANYRLISEASSPAPNFIEDGLFRAFVKLDVDTLSVIDAKPVPMYPAMSQESIEIYNQMPTEFSDLQEADTFWEILMRSLMHSVHNMYWMAPLDGDGSEKSIFDTVVPGQQHPTQERLAKVYQDFNNYRNAFAKWNEGFEPLYERYRFSPSSNEYMPALDLRIRYLACSTPYLGTFDDEVASDQSLPTYQEIIRLAEEVITHSQGAGKASFLFYGPVIGSLYAVGLKCRDPATRRKSISLLRENPRREGLWDSVLMARINEIQMEIEERGMVSGFIPEESRVKVIRASYDLEDRSGWVRYRMSGFNLPTEQVKLTW